MRADLETRIRRLRSEDFEEGDGMSELRTIVEELESEPDPRWAVGVLFDALERLDGADLGAPGPIVHFLEAVGGYEEELRRSLNRKPTSYALWMVNRILNGTHGAPRESWLEEMRKVSMRHDIKTELADEAKDYLSFQASGGIGRVN
jgi:hypothetical protein